MVEALRTLPEDMPQVDSEEHKTRYRTLLAIARQYREQPERFGIVNVWRPRYVAAEAREARSAMNTKM